MTEGKRIISRRTMIQASTLVGLSVAAPELARSASYPAVQSDPETTLNVGTSVLLTIDTQNDFSLRGAPAEVSGTSEIIPNMRKVLVAYREQKLPIVHLIRLYEADGSNVDRPRRTLLRGGAKVVLPNTQGAELVADLKPTPSVHLFPGELLTGETQQIGPREWIIYKPRWGAFYKTTLEQHLRGLGIDTVIVTGCNYPNCPRSALYEASERDFRIGLVTDAVSGLYDKGAQELSGIGANLLTSDQLISRVHQAS